MRALVVALFLAVVATAFAGGYRNPTRGKDVALQIPGMHLAKVRRDLVYKPGLRLDVYRRGTRRRGSLRSSSPTAGPARRAPRTGASTSAGGSSRRPPGSPA